MSGASKSRRRPQAWLSAIGESGRILGLEYWEASKRLPAELLDALPAPPSRDVVMERQPA